MEKVSEPNMRVASIIAESSQHHGMTPPPHTAHVMCEQPPDPPPPLKCAMYLDLGWGWGGGVQKCLRQLLTPLPLKKRGMRNRKLKKEPKSMLTALAQMADA